MRWLEDCSRVGTDAEGTQSHKTASEVAMGGWPFILVSHPDFVVRIQGRAAYPTRPAENLQPRFDRAFLAWQWLCRSDADRDQLVNNGVTVGALENDGHSDKSNTTFCKWVAVRFRGGGSGGGCGSSSEVTGGRCSSFRSVRIKVAVSPKSWEAGVAVEADFSTPSLSCAHIRDQTGKRVKPATRHPELNTGRPATR